MFIDFLSSVVVTTFEALKSSADWLIISFIIAGMLRNFVSPERFMRMLGNNKLSSIFKSTGSAMLLPVCSCGTFPVAISMYYSGANLGPVLTFLTANPILNPIAILLSIGLLGPKLTIIYVITGFILSICVGILGNSLGGSEVSLFHGEAAAGREIELEEEDRKTFFQKVKLGLHWAFHDLAMMVSKYVVLGMVFVGLLLTLSKMTGVQHILMDPSMVSLGSIAVLAGIMYVCAVGHIPFIATLIATGVAPGVAITFLMAGAATNLPELMTLYKVIGKRSVIIYFSVVVIGAILGGYAANLILMPGFEPVMDYNKITGTIDIANKLTLNSPEYIKVICSLIIISFGGISVFKSIKSGGKKLSNRFRKA